MSIQEPAAFAKGFVVPGKPEFRSQNEQDPQREEKMKKIRLLKILFMLSGLVIVGLFTIAPVAAEDVPRLKKELLVRYLDNAEVYIFDVRREEDWKESEFKIKGAIREKPKNFNLWVQQYRDNQAYILYCADPDGKTSAALVQKLRENNFNKAYALKGGWSEWLKAKYPVEKK